MAWKSWSGVADEQSLTDRMDFSLEKTPQRPSPCDRPAVGRDFGPTRNARPLPINYNVGVRKVNQFAVEMIDRMPSVSRDEPTCANWVSFRTPEENQGGPCSRRFEKRCLYLHVGCDAPTRLIPRGAPSDVRLPKVKAI